MMILGILIALLLLFAVLIMYSACVVAGDADEREREYWERNDEQMG